MTTKKQYIKALDWDKMPEWVREWTMELLEEEVCLRK